MNYLAALDYAHLDNGVFLTTLAKSLAQQQAKKEVRSIIVHGDSAYTERVIQTGVVREEAVIRSVKDLNHRLVALFADQGVSTVGINPSQRNLVSIDGNNLRIDHSFLNELPHQSVLLLSTLVQDIRQDKPVVLELARLTEFLFEQLEVDRCFIFSKSDKAEVFTSNNQPDEIKWNTMDESFRNKQIPDDLNNLRCPANISTARDFNEIPDLKHTIYIC